VAGLSLGVTIMVWYGYHTFQFEPLDQWINGSMDTVIMETLILKRLTHMEQFMDKDFYTRENAVDE